MKFYRREEIKRYEPGEIYGEKPVVGLAKKLLGGLNLSKAFPKGVRHPDSLVKRRDLYFTPTNRPRNWKKLYFGAPRTPRTRR